MLELRIKYIKKLDQKKIKQKEVCFALDFSRQAVSKWLAKFRVEGEAGLIPKKSGPKKGTAWNKTDQDTEDTVVHIARQHPFKGPDWLADKLEQWYGIDLDQSTVYRILKRRRVRYHQDYKKERRKKKAYCLDRPGRELQLDVNFPFGYSRKEVVYDAIDDCSRFVFAKVMPNHGIDSSIAFLKELIQKCPFPIEVIRTDQGKEFSQRITLFLKEKGIKHKKNAPYTPQHNGKIERYHRTFKENETYFWPFCATLNELNYRLTHWLYYYNYQKKHTGLGMNKLTPAQKIAYTLIANSFDKNVNLILQQNKYLHI